MKEKITIYRWTSETYHYFWKSMLFLMTIIDFILIFIFFNKDDLSLPQNIIMGFSLILAVLFFIVFISNISKLDDSIEGIIIYGEKEK